MDELLDHLNRRIDHALLKPEATQADILAGAELCRDLNLCAFCVNPAWVTVAAEVLRHTDTAVISVAGFPLGASRSDTKTDEALRAVSDGANEIDMVANIGWLRSKEMSRVRDEIETVRKALPYNISLKVIIECTLLSPEQQIDAVTAVTDGGAQFVKTGTGFVGGATMEQVERLVKAANGKIEVKAAGGIRILDDCRNMLTAGATRLGSSSSADIVAQWRQNANQ